MVLQVTLLGEQLVTDDGGTVHLRSSRTLALIALLVVHAGSPQPRQRIAGLFWPDSTDEQALTNLRRELHHLRAVLGDDPSLIVTPRTLCWQDTPGCVVDVRIFTAAAAGAREAARREQEAALLAQSWTALDAYRGEFLPGGLEDWVLDARNALEQQCVEVLDLVVTARTRAGQLPAAVEAARRRVALRPLEETGYRTLMELQGDLGDRAGAVSTYHRCASVLERELGVEPDPLTRRTLDRLLAGSRPPAADGSAGRALRSAPRLVGRAEELRRLHRLWRSAADGNPALVVLRGEAGVGKTRLMTELAEVARSGGAVVAGAQCFGTAGRLALAPVADWLRAPPVRSVLSGLEPVWRMEVERLVPSTKGSAGTAAGPRAMVDAWQRHRFYEGVSRALLAVGRPLLLTVDNLHWCDQETLAFLTFHLRLAAGAPVMVAATLRETDDGAEPGLAQWIVRMRATGLLTELPVGPFDAAETAELAATVTGRPLPEPDADLLQATTGGFPLFIVEAARAGDGGGSLPVGDLSAVLADRLGQVSEAARAVAGLAAAVGRDFPLDLLTEASDLDADTVVAAVDELWRRRILREDHDGYDFSHDLLRDVAYAQVSPPQRWLLHRRVAQALELLHADDPDAVSAQLAEQYARGGRAERAVDYYRRAAEVAARTFAHDEAIRLHEEALAVVAAMPEGRERSGRELQLLEGMAAPLNARSGYASPRLRETLERAIALAEVLGRREALLNGLVGLSFSQFVHGDTATAQRTAARALTLMEPGSELSGTAAFAFGGSTLSLGRPAEALRHFEAAEASGSTWSLSVGTRTDVHSKAFAAHAHWLLGSAEDALASATGAIALARSTGSPYSLAVALAYGSITHQLLGDLTALRATVAELGDLCGRYDFAYYREWALIFDGWVRGGRAGVAAARRGLDGLTAEGSLARMPYWLSLFADLAARDGRPDVARATLDAAISGGRAHDDVWWLPEVMRLRAGYDESDERAAERLREAAALADQHGSAALLLRCTADLLARGMSGPPFAVRPAR